VLQVGRVKTAAGRYVDYDLACLLMDQELLQRARDEALEGLDSFNDPDGFDMACARNIYKTDGVRLPPLSRSRDERDMVDEIWRKYCHFHRNKYRSEFEPDVSPS